MSVLNRDEFFDSLQNFIGESAEDDALKFLEDMTDTYNDMDTRLQNSEGADWEQRYHDLDASWKEKYKKRFFSGGTTNVPPVIVNNSGQAMTLDDEPEDDITNVTFKDLFS